MSFTEDVRGVVLRIVDLLEAGGFPYLVMGGLAVSIWGIPRATYDVDLLLSVDEAGVERFLRVVKGAGFSVDAPFEKGFRDVLRGMQKVTIEWWTPEPRRVEVDVFLATTTYQRAAFARRVRAKIDGREVWVLGAADLILHKLAAGRPKDIADVQNLLAVQGVPDRQYLEEWAARLAVQDRLRQALKDAGLA